MLDELFFVVHDFLSKLRHIHMILLSISYCHLEVLKKAVFGAVELVPLFPNLDIQGLQHTPQIDGMLVFCVVCYSIPLQAHNNHMGKVCALVEYYIIPLVHSVGIL